MVFGAGGASTPGYLIRNHPLYWCTDGSGGKYGQDARLVRAGWGAVGDSCKVPFPQRAAAWGALYGPLPGELQGFDRAEIWALLQLLERTLGDLVVGTDCDYLVRCSTSDDGLARAASRTVRIGTALNRRRKVIVYKVRAHVLAPDSPLELAAHTWTSVVGNELADACAEKGALLPEVPVDVVRAVSEADFLAVRIQKQFHTTAIQAVPELKGSAKAPGSREARRLTLPQLMAATEHDLLRDPLKLQGQWHCSRCGHTIAHKQLREWLLNVPCVPLLPTTLPDLFHAGQPVSRGSRRNPTSSGNLRTIKGCTYAVWSMGSARKPRAPTQGPCTAVWGHPHENPGRRPKNRAGVVEVLL